MKTPDKSFNIVLYLNEHNTIEFKRDMIRLTLEINGKKIPFHHENVFAVLHWNIYRILGYHRSIAATTQAIEAIDVHLKKYLNKDVVAMIVNFVKLSRYDVDLWCHTDKRQHKKLKQSIF